jgi:hypothetical protein
MHGDAVVRCSVGRGRARVGGGSARVGGGAARVVEVTVMGAAGVVLLWLVHVPAGQLEEAEVILPRHEQVPPMPARPTPKIE